MLRAFLARSRSFATVNREPARVLIILPSVLKRILLNPVMRVVTSNCAPGKNR